MRQISFCIPHFIYRKSGGRIGLSQGIKIDVRDELKGIYVIEVAKNRKFNLSRYIMLLIFIGFTLLLIFYLFFVSVFYLNSS